MDLAFYFIATRNALTFFIAKFPLRKALAVHFEAIYLGTLAALAWDAPRREVKFLNGAENLSTIFPRALLI
jgi:hypothetical protein